MILLFWQLYIAYSCAVFASLIYIFNNDKDNILIRTVSDIPIESYEMIPNWLKIVSHIISSLSWPVSLIINLKEKNKYNQLIEENEFLSTLIYNSKCIKYIFFIIELIMIYFIRKYY